MNSLIFLSDQEFSIQEGKKGKILCNNLPGVSLVLFFSERCPHCVQMFPIFKTLPQLIQGCQFAAINISTYQNVAEMSQRTISPITHVPFIILYVNNRPFIRYNGAKTLRDVSNFINEVLSRIQNKKQFINPKLGIDDMEAIPEYSIGIPFNMVCDANGSDNCYLTFGEAYKK